jgi:hypothetical protein
LATPEEQATIARTLDELREARAGIDRDLIRDKTTELNQVTARLAEAMMDAALKGALGSRRANEIMESS